MPKKKVKSDPKLIEVAVTLQQAKTAFETSSALRNNHDAYRAVCFAIELFEKATGLDCPRLRDKHKKTFVVHEKEGYFITDEPGPNDEIVFYGGQFDAECRLTLEVGRSCCEEEEDYDPELDGTD